MPRTRETNVSNYTPVSLSGREIEPTEVKVTIEDATHKLFLKMACLHVQDNQGEDILDVSTGSGLGGDFVTIVYRHSDGHDRYGVFYLRDIAAEFIRKVDDDASVPLLDTLDGKDGTER